jgi:predicted dienelactone hydrolase
MDSTLTRHVLRALAALLALAAGPALAINFNHENVVNPLPLGRFEVACSHIAQDTALIAPGASASDYWEGRPVNGQDHYITEILANPQATLQFNARVPDQRSLYPGHAGDNVAFVAIVCHPTPRDNGDPDYTLPQTGDVIPHMQPAGVPPKLISSAEYAATLGIAVDPATSAPQRLPLVVYSHGLTGSPISQGYVQVMAQLAAQGFMVAGVFHGDPRFARFRIEDLADLAYLVRNFDRVVEMQLMRPVGLKAMTDLLLADSGFAPAIDVDRIGGFGASMGGEAMALLLGAKLTTSLGGNCSDAVHDPRIKAAVGYVPYAGQTFLPAFCNGQSGAASVARPYLAISGTADTTAPIGPAQQAVNNFGSSRYLVELVGGQHELRPEDIGDLFTWMITFLDAYLDVRADPTAMARLVKMRQVRGGAEDNLVVDVHVPFANAAGESTAREFYNTILDHYFVAAGADEIANIVAGGAGAGWQLTGQGFKVYPAMPADTFTAVGPVCRFYGRPAGGPNSHFFTASPAECDSVKRQGGWFYEGIGFYIRPVGADGKCPDGFLGVNRAYNNGFPRNDSNHRFTTSDSYLREMGRKGWAMEGTVMCARP